MRGERRALVPVACEDSRGAEQFPGQALEELAAFAG